MAQPKNRETVVETVYHQVLGEEPTSLETRYNRDLESNEQVYERQAVATEEWKLLDCGWLSGNVGLLVIRNEEGKSRQTNPTEAEKEELAKRVIEVCHLGSVLGGWFIPPSTSMRGYPSHPPSLRIRCLHGTAKYRLFLIPK